MVVGSDLRADLRVAHPLIARAHVLLRFDQGRWLAVDNNSLNGVYVDGHRVPVVDIHDGQTINIGKPDGPRITFEVGQHTGSVGLLPPTTNSVPIIAARPGSSAPVPPPGPRPAAGHGPLTHPSRPFAPPPSRPLPAARYPAQVRRSDRPAGRRDARRPAVRGRHRTRPGAATPGPDRADATGRRPAAPPGSGGRSATT